MEYSQCVYARFRGCIFKFEIPVYIICGISAARQASADNILYALGNTGDTYLVGASVFLVKLRLSVFVRLYLPDII